MTREAYNAINIVIAVLKYRNNVFFAILLFSLISDKYYRSAIFEITSIILSYKGSNYLMIHAPN